MLLTLDDATDAAACGHKAATLAALKNLGFDVPDGFVIPAGARPAPADIEAALARLGNGAVAVRSSGIAEDLPDASYAGQYDTVLNVRGAGAVLDAAAACVRSAHGERVGLYDGRVQPMAVLVQQMVDADVSGVAFSANPLTGNRAEARVSATRGLGDRLVSGAIDADEWLVTGDRASAVAEPQQAIRPDIAVRVAALARKAESARSAPQDIEWAVASGRLWLLQSRPITMLPVAPAITTPKGSWLKDAAHFPEPLSPFAASTQMRDASIAFDEAIATWGLLPDAVRFAVIGHEPYIHVEPDDGGKNPPPWWLLGMLARLVPSMRRKLRAADRAITSGLLDSMPREWETTLRPRLRRDIEAFAARDLTALDHDALCAHVEELTVFYTRSLQLHFSLFVPHVVGLHELAVACEELLGWDLPKTMGLLQGSSSISTAAIDELASMDLQQYLRFWGLRPIGPEPGSPTIAEQPHLVADLLAEASRGGSRADTAAARLALVDDARAQLSGPARSRFDAALAYAERVYPLREDNVLLTDQLQVGLLRRAALEAGRRLVALGLLGRAEDAVMLTADELRHALETNASVRALVSRRKAEHAWVRANPGPMTYGAEPGPPPDLRGLPAAARRINTALLWMMGHELAAPPSATGDTISGMGVSPGVYRGTVRVITSPDQLHTLRAGEILVCPTTSAAWMMVFRRAGAIVADTGSVLSHTAIVAREFALPAVVATGNGTSTLRTGDEVTVDGTRGVITRASPPPVAAT